MKQARATGFTLVETALGLLVVAIGMMALLGLFPTGFETGRRVTDETVAAQFAGQVFATLRADAGDTNIVTTFCNLGSIVLMGPPNSSLWLNHATMGVTASTAPAGTPGGTVRYRYNDGGGGIEEYVLRYRLVVADRVAWYAYASGAAPGPAYARGKSAKLYVWPGEFGPTTTNNAIAFYTELYNGGM
jgi:type II secretory pathway pseudopilin PulG